MVQCGICLSEYQVDEYELHLTNCSLHLVFRCTHCNADYMNKEGLWNHMDQHEIADESKELHCQEITAKHKLHQCVLCNDQRAYSENLYWEHIQVVHDGFFLRCSECGESFKSEKLRNDHASRLCRVQPVTSESHGHEMIDKIIVQEKPRYFCANCGKNFTHKGLYQGHFPACEQRKHPCEICGRKFKHPQIVNYHKIRHHKNEGDLDQKQEPVQENDPKIKNTVTESSSSSFHNQKQIITIDDFATSQKVQNVEAEDHAMQYSSNQVRVDADRISSPFSEKSSIDLYRCHICGVCCSTPARAQYHKLTQHTEAKHQCLHCLKKFFDKKRLTIHSKVCADRNTPCELCGHKLKTKKGVIEHMKRVHNVDRSTSKILSESTDYTGEQDKSSDSLEANKKKVTKSSRTICPHCGKDFYHGVLPRHIKQCHIPCSCDICGIPFSNTIEKDHHKRTTHKEPLYNCPYCPQQFKLAAQYCTHLPLCISRKFTCDICGYKFERNISVVRHKNRFHQTKKAKGSFIRAENGNEEKQYNQNKKNASTKKIQEKKLSSNIIVITDCPICGEHCGDQHLVDQHIETVHRMAIRVFCADDLSDHELQTTEHNNSQLNVDNSANVLPLGSTVEAKDAEYGENMELEMEVKLEDTIVQENQYRDISSTTTLVNL